jgi:peptidoglycan/LPS O-acetylase OafA/YrhL
MSTDNRRLDRFYHPEIDVLRFLAFFGVFFHHAFPQTADKYAMLPASVQPWIVALVMGAGWGVDLFFALSAYLITELLIREHQRSQRIDVRAFYIRRTLRIWPLYFLFLTFTLLVVPFLVQWEYLPLAHRIGFTLFSANWAIAFNGYPPSVASPLWSVSIEEQFYIVWPLVIAYVGIRYIPRVAVAMLITAWITRILLMVGGVEHPGVYTNTFARLDPIAAGAILAVALRGGSLRLSAIWRVLLSVLAVVVLIVTTRYGAYDGVRSLLTYPIVAGASVLLILAFLHDENAVPRLLRNQFLVLLGRMSYGLYVFHVFAQTFVKNFIDPGDGPISLVIYFGTSLVLTMLLGAASYRWIERPFLSLKERFTVVQSRPV